MINAIESNLVDCAQNTNEKQVSLSQKSFHIIGWGRTQYENNKLSKFTQEMALVETRQVLAGPNTCKMEIYLSLLGNMIYQGRLD